MSDEPLLLSVREAARALGTGRDNTYQLIREGRLHAVHVSGRKILVPRAELTAFVERESAAEPRP
jgi:excisionase family DNA binding protein